MSTDYINPENLSKELLKSACDAALMDTSYDNDGDLSVKEQLACWIIPDMKSKDRIKLLSLFGFKPEASNLERLECVNRINRAYIIVKAYVSDNDCLFFQYDLYIGDGISKKTFIKAVKRFCSIPREAIRDHGAEIVL